MSAKVCWLRCLVCRWKSPLGCRLRLRLLRYRAPSRLCPVLRRLRLPRRNSLRRLLGLLLRRRLLRLLPQLRASMPQAIDEIERRKPERLALIHFGVASA